MFRVSKALSRLNGLPRRTGLNLGARPQQALLAPTRFQRAAFASKKDDKADPPPPKQPIDYEAERKIGERKLEARPSEVSVKSSTTNALKTPTENLADNPILQNELQHDMGIIKDTFSLDNVPRESKVLGLAGTIPYFATSLSTVYLGWDLKQELPSGNAFYDAIIIDHGTAQYLLSIIEPVQLGYGAVIISFLGAIHWGLEYAEKKPSAERTRFRYGMGLIAPIVAWPTLIMPVPYALTTQFLAFVGLYFADARATTRGWAPTWYGSYRFMLTAMVGLALFVSLVGRQKMSQGNALTQEGLQKRLEQTGRADHDTDWAKLEAEEKKRLKKEKAEAEKKAKKEAEKKDKKGKDVKEAGKEAKDAKKSNEEKTDDDDAKEEDDGRDNNDTKKNENDQVEEGNKDENQKQNKNKDKDEDEDEDEDKDENRNDQEDEGNEDDDSKDDEKDKGEEDDSKQQKGDKKDAENGKNQKSKDKQQAKKADKESESQKGTGK